MAREKKPGRIKSAVLDWLGVPISLKDGAFWQEWFGTSASGQHVTVDKALQLSTVWACVRLLSESVSTLPLKLYRRSPKNRHRLFAAVTKLFQVLNRVQASLAISHMHIQVMLLASLINRDTFKNHILWCD